MKKGRNEGDWDIHVRVGEEARDKKERERESYFEIRWFDPIG